MNISAAFTQLGIALGLGILVGLQREHAETREAGIRTFPLITLLGTLCGMLAQSFGGWTIGAGLIALAGLIVIGSLSKSRQETNHPGLTTEVAMLLMFVVGAYLTVGYKEVAIAVGGGIAVLLQFKKQMHAVTQKLGEEDLKAIMQFAFVSLVILPVLPNQTYGPYEVLNPRQIWWMVVLIVGINLGGYIIYKFFGQEAGIVSGGILGGLISSTATTASYARRTKAAPEISKAAALVIVIASSVVFVRILLEISVVSPAFFTTAFLPISFMLVLFVALAIVLWFRAQKEEVSMPPQDNPSQLNSALFFGLIYAVVLFAVAAAKAQFGDKGLYLVAALSGLTDVDAITLSTSQLVGTGRLDANHGWKIVLVALLSNIVFKGVTIAALGSRPLLKNVSLSYGLVLAAGLLLLLLW
jgi:uncharacterized membrane protein (DUF4010 family)